MPRIALAVDAPEGGAPEAGSDRPPPDWHARALVRAFVARGTALVQMRLADCAFDAGRRHGIVLPGFGDELPDAVLVRAISGGTFEEVTRRLGVLHALARLGVTVWNEARAIERCVDKSATTFLLAASGLPVPPSWAVEGRAAALAVARREAEHGPLVLKPLFGSQGRGLRLIARPDELPPPEEVGGVYYLQRFIAPAGDAGGFSDHRVFVCAGAAIASMVRRSPGWITNIGQGGTPERADPDEALEALAVRAADAVGAAYAGVDLLRGRDGRPMVLEVNSMPAWRGLQTVTEVPIADRVADALLARVR